MAMSIYQFPAQKKLLSEKTDAWAQECMEAAISISYSDSSKIRKSKMQKKINYDLINGIIDESDIERAFNPMGIKGVQFPAKIQNYPIEVAKFNVLKGEESKRRFDWKLRSVNEGVISEKEFQMRDQVLQLLSEEVVNQNYSEELAQRRMQQLQHYQQYEYQDYAEVLGTRILDYHWYTQRLKDLFSDAFYDVLIAAEEIYDVSIIHGEPIASKLSPLCISTMGGADSHKIEDYDIIVDDKYVSVGAIIDELWDEFSSEEIDKLESGNRENRLSGDIVFAGPMMKNNSIDNSNSQLITINGADAFNYNGSFDTDGNIRRTKVIWRSRRKLGELTYYDQEGRQLTTFVDEKFPIKQFESLGWKIKWHWINEWWSGIRVGADMYKKMQPIPRIGSKFSNPSICLPPICGTVYNVGGSSGVSLMDRVKPYKYLYNVYMRRTELASARNKGVIAELDLAEIPDGWDEELIMMFAEANGYLIKDSFKEGKKGQATGKLIGTVKQRGSDVINLDSSNIIRANLELAQYVKRELSEIAGVSPQREGDVGGRETLGGVELAITKSSHVTEEWFRLHDNTKLRVMELLLETSKYAWRNATGETAKKLQYIDDGGISHLFSVDGRKLAETEYGSYISNGQADAELVQAIKGLAQAMIQNDKITMKDLFSVYRNTSIAGMEKRLESSEQERNQREDDARKEQLASNERVQQAMQKIEEMRMAQEERLAMARIEADIYMTELEIESKMVESEMSKDGADTEKLQLELQKLKENAKLKREDMARRDKEYKDKLAAQEKLAKLNIQSSEKIAKSRKAASAIK